MSEIAAAVEASLQNTSQHLRLMREMGVLESRREGQMILYHVNKNSPSVKCQLVDLLAKDDELGGDA